MEDMHMRSGDVWLALKDHSSRHPHMHTLVREKAMLESLTYDEVRDYALQPSDDDAQAPRLDPTKVEELIHKATIKQKHAIAKLETERDAHAAARNDGSDMVPEHRECVNCLATMQMQAEELAKASIVKFLYHDAEMRAVTRLRQDLWELSSSQLWDRAASNGIVVPTAYEDSVHSSDSSGPTPPTLASRTRTTCNARLPDERGHKPASMQKRHEVVDLIVDVEIGRTRGFKKVGMWWRRIRLRGNLASLQSLCDQCERKCAIRCFQSTVRVSFTEQGPLGIRLAGGPSPFRIVEIRELSQAALNHKVQVGLVLRTINGAHVDCLGRQQLLQMLHAANRPLCLTFTRAHSQQQLHQTTDAFWDDASASESSGTQITVLDIEDGELPTDLIDQHDTAYDLGGNGMVPLPLRQYGTALVAQHRAAIAMTTFQRSRNASVHVSSDESASTGTSANRDIEHNSFGQIKDKYEVATRNAAHAAERAQYRFKSCTVHAANVPDTLSNDDLLSLFAVFGTVVQATVKPRPGINTNWALVTMCDSERARNVISVPQKYDQEPTDLQIKQLQHLQTVQLAETHAIEYGTSWSEAEDKAEAFIRSIALNTKGQLRDDFGVFVQTNSDHRTGPSSVQISTRHRAYVCEPRRQIATLMRVCESAVDSLFYACDRDNSGTLDRDELRLLMSELENNGGVSESSIQFVIDQVKAYSGDGDGEITRARLKPAIALWRYLLHEQQSLAKEFDAFDSRVGDKDPDKDDIDELLRKLNSDKDHPDGVPPTAAETEWIMSKIQAQDFNTTGTGTKRAKLRAAIALWYPCVHRRRNVRDLALTPQIRAGHRRRALVSMLEVYHHQVNRFMQTKFPATTGSGCTDNSKLYRLTRRNLGSILTHLASTGSRGDSEIAAGLRFEQVSMDAVDYVLTLADLQGAEVFEPGEIQSACGIWLCIRDIHAEMEDLLDNFNHSEPKSSQRQQMRSIINELNDGIPTLWAETEWILASSDVDGVGTTPRDELRASLAHWLLHVSKRKVSPNRGCKAFMPWLYALGVSLACTYLVASTAVRFSEQKTQRWLVNSAWTIAFKQLVVEPGKVLLFGVCAEHSSLTRRVIDAVLAQDEHGSGNLSTHGVDGELHRSAPAVGDNTTLNGRYNATGGIMIGSVVAKIRRNLQRDRTRRIVEETATQATRESRQILQRVQSRRAEMNSIYATTVARKRVQQGLDRGEFAVRAQADMAAVTQFMTAKESTVLNQDSSLQERVDLISEAQRDIKQREQHISHLKGLASVKTMERVRRKRNQRMDNAQKSLDKAHEPLRLKEARSRRGLGDLINDRVHVVAVDSDHTPQSRPNAFEAPLTAVGLADVVPGHHVAD